nr:hypothetical protein [Streptacidiphilus jeojiense]
MFSMEPVEVPETVIPTPPLVCTLSPARIRPVVPSAVTPPPVALLVTAQLAMVTNEAPEATLTASPVELLSKAVSVRLTCDEAPSMSTASTGDAVAPQENVLRVTVMCCEPCTLSGV